MNYIPKFDSGLPDGLGSFAGLRGFSNEDVHAKSTAAGSDAIVIPDADLLFSGDYKRSGLDLVLSKDGHEFTVHDYFRGEKRATLASPDGANLSGQTVGALAGQVDYAQAGGAVALAEIIGRVTKLTGSATAVRNGVSITLNVGDNVHKGDVVQSGSESSLGITFVDGTVFGLSANARMVLNDMVYDPNGSTNSSLLTLVAGTISFVAGATAKNGGMKVDTPTATMGIRGTAVLVEIDFDIQQPGLAPPVSFRVLVEPNGVTGEYVLLDKTTLQPIATVNQAGTKTTVNGLGAVTFLSSAPISNDAQKLITDLFALKFTDANPKDLNIPPLDSITPQSFFTKLTDGTPLNQLPIFVTAFFLEVPATPPASGGNHRYHLNIPPDIFASSNSFTEHAGTTGTAALDTVSGIIRFADINPEDLPTVSARFDTFAYRDAQQNVVTSFSSEQLTAIRAVQTPLSILAGHSNTNIGEASWTYSLPDHAFDFLAAGETLTLTYIARVDTNYVEYNTAVFQSFTITVTGTNDLPTLAGTGSGFVEKLGTNNPNNVINHAEGEITFTDADLTDRPTVTAPFTSYVYTSIHGVTALTPAQLAEVAAALTLTPSSGNGHNGSVAWSYDVADHVFDFIAAGETLVLNYTAIVDDHHGGVVSIPLQVTIGVDGTNDVPTITATSNGFAESSVITGDTTAHLVGGTINFTDADLTDRPTVTTSFASYVYNDLNPSTPLSAAQLAAVASVHPALSLTPAGTNANNGSVAWSYQLPDNSFDFLARGETLELTYTATVFDGHVYVSTPLTVTITGSNDVPVAIGDANTTDTVVESGVNPGDTAFTGDAIAAGNVLTNDTDADLNHVLTVAAVEGLTTNVGATVTGTYGSITIAANGSYIYTLNNGDSDTEALAQGATATDMFTYTVTDEFGATSTANLTITITGTNDAPVANGDVNGADVVTEAGVNAGNTPVTGDATAAGNVLTNDTDVDTGHTLTVAAVQGVPGNVGNAVIGIYGSITIDAHGNYSYTLDNGDPDTQALAQGATVTDVFAYTVTDQFGATSTANLTITITGTNDAPVANGDVNGADVVTEAGVNPGNTPFADDATAAGNVLTNDTDVDTGHTLTVAAVQGIPGNVGNAVIGIYGSITIDAHGNYSYTLDNGDPDTQALAQGATVTDVFAYTVTDEFGATSIANLTITITGTNDAPMANGDVNGADVVVESGVNPLNALFAGDPTAAGNVLTNDTDVDTGHSLTVAAVQGLGSNIGTAVIGTYGSITVASDGSYIYTLDNGDVDTQALAQGALATDAFAYTVTDQFGATSIANLTITVAGTNDAPVAVADSNTSDAVVESGVDPLNAPFAGDPTAVGYVLTNDTDVDTGHLLTVAAVQGVALNVGAAVIGVYGSVSIAANGSYTYTLDNADPDTQALAQGAPATDVFAYTVTDEFGATSTANLTINITGTNDAPVISTAGVHLTSGPGGQATFSGISVSDVDASAGEIFTIGASATSGHSVTGSGTGPLSTVAPTLSAGIVYDPGATPPTDTVKLSVADGHGGSDTVNFIFQSAISPPIAPVTLTGTSEKDVFFGTGNADQFVFAANSNHDTIVDFTAGTDHIDLSALSSLVTSATLSSFLTNNVTTVGTDTLITLDGHDTITLRNVLSGNVHAGDFIVHA